MTSFWGLIVEGGKRYKQTVPDQFHMTMAALDITSVKGNPKNINVMVQTRDLEFILCSLNEQRPQERLNLMFGEGETISFFTNADCKVHLTGYLMPEEDFIEEFGEEEDEEASDLEVGNLQASNGKRKHAEQLQLQGKKMKTVEAEKKPEGEKKQPAKQKIVDVDPRELQNEKKQNKAQQQKKQVKLVKQVEEGEDDEVDSEIDSEDLEKLINEASDDDDDDDDMDDFDDDDDDDDDDEDLDDDDSADEKMLKVQQKLKANLSGQTANNKQQAKTPNKQQNQPKTPQQQPKSPQQQGKQNQQQGRTPQQKNNNLNQSNQNRQQTPFTKGNNKPNQQQQNSNKKGTPFQKNPNHKDGSEAESSAKSSDTGKQANERKEQVKKLPNGLMIQDIVEGSGSEAKKGKFLHMNYVGKLTNNRVFDKTTNRPFSFRLGMGEVIKGWDLGIQGMKVGGKRKLTIPAALGYGKTGAGKDIPPNATLVFDVELKGVSS